MTKNQIGLCGISFIEMTARNTMPILNTLKEFGFSPAAGLKNRDITLLRQNRISIILNSEKTGLAAKFADLHGPSICSMGWKFKNPQAAFKLALQRGARAVSTADYSAPAVYGIGDSLIYFLSENPGENLEEMGFHHIEKGQTFAGKGFLEIDHLTNNVYPGDLERWSKFYKDIFEFTDVRTFSIHGEKTGLLSYALRSADGSFCIPINEGTEKKSQINEYLEEYRGPGIQHLAFLSHDLLSSLRALEGTSVQMLDIKQSYYETAFSRVPKLQEDRNEIKKYSVLVDGDEEGYLLQIFTKNLFGPIFIELIQRRNHLSFGEGNFQALFDSIERDQEKRGYL